MKNLPLLTFTISSCTDYSAYSEAKRTKGKKVTKMYKAEPILDAPILILAVCLGVLVGLAMTGIDLLMRIS